MAGIRQRLTYANVTATIALFLALTTGGVYAASKIKLKNKSVTTQKIRDSAVTGPKLADSSVDGLKIADGSIGSGDLAGGAVTKPKLAANSVTGANVLAGSLELADVADAVVSIAPNFGIFAAGECKFDISVPVPGKLDGDIAIVIPESTDQGWNSNLILDGYSSGGASPNTVGLQVCSNSATSVADPVPFTVLLFR